MEVDDEYGIGPLRGRMLTRKTVTSARLNFEVIIELEIFEVCGFFTALLCEATHLHEAFLLILPFLVRY